MNEMKVNLKNKLKEGIKKVGRPCKGETKWIASPLSRDTRPSPILEMRP